MRLLLGTHPLLWWVTDSPDLSDEARQAIADRRNAVHVSVASLWEIAIKAAKGKPSLHDDFDRTLDQEPFGRLAILTPLVRGAPCRTFTAIRLTACWSPRLASRA